MSKYVVIGSVVSNDADRTILESKEMGIEHAKKLHAKQGRFVKPGAELWVVKVVAKVRVVHEPTPPMEVIDEDT